MACVTEKFSVDFRNSWIQELSDIIRHWYLGQSLSVLFTHSLASCLSAYLLLSSPSFFFFLFAAFSDRLPSHGKEGHMPLGFLDITLVPQAERASLFPSSSGLSADARHPPLSPVPIPGPVIMTVISQVLCSARG